MHFMKAVQSLRQDEFENVVLAELQELRKTEKALQEMYPRLKTKPQLRNTFMQQLADMQQRAYRLDAVLNPTGAVHFGSSVPVASQPFVA
jgi:ferritin-like metal-binding protein YciE